MKAEQRDRILTILEERFHRHAQRHAACAWPDVLARLEGSPAKLASLASMEESGGEPDVIGHDAATGEYLFCDCSPESPVGRRSLCYDQAALAARKEAKPRDSALGMAAAMGVTLLTEEQYRYLQSVGSFDQKTSSWLDTPAAIRELGGAIFADHRFGRMFVYHNGVQSYYAGRGFRALLRV